jgi:hypothetical protein
MGKARKERMKELESKLNSGVQKFINCPDTLNDLELNRLSLFLTLQDQVDRDPDWPLNIGFISQAFVVAVLPLILEYVAVAFLH